MRIYSVGKIFCTCYFISLFICFICGGNLLLLSEDPSQIWNRLKHLWSGHPDGFEEISLVSACRSITILMYQSIPKPPISPPRTIPGHLTRVNLRTVGNLTQNEARPVGHLTFVSKRLSAVGSKRISQFFDSAGEPRSRVITLFHSTWVFLLLSFYIVLPWNMPLFKV